MRLYIKGDYTKEILFDYQYLAKKMWLKEKDGKVPSFSYGGHTNVFKHDPTINLKLSKWQYDERWNNILFQSGMMNEFSSHIYEDLNLEFENLYISDYREKGDYLRIASKHLELLTLDKRAIYIMAIEVASALEGLISEDDKNTWLTVEEFRSKHQDILSLTFEEANERSLEEITTMEAIEEPLWEELDRLREAYIAKHGERVYPDDEE